MDVNGRAATTAAELDQLLADAQPAAASQLLDIDHVYPAANGAAAATTDGHSAETLAILYGAVGTQCFAALHAKLVAATSAPPGELESLEQDI